MSKTKGYSNEFKLTVLSANPCGLSGLISEVRYADGQVRQIGYDSAGAPNRFVDADGSVWMRQDGSNTWVCGDEVFEGTIEVVPSGSKDNVAGSISIRFLNDGFVVGERIIFPIGIVVESRFARDRTELERSVRLLNGKQLQFRREHRNGLWFRQDGDVAHQPENPFHFGLPWRYPAVAAIMV